MKQSRTGANVKKLDETRVWPCPRLGAYRGGTEDRDRRRSIPIGLLPSPRFAMDHTLSLTLENKPKGGSDAKKLNVKGVWPCPRQGAYRGGTEDRDRRRSIPVGLLPSPRVTIDHTLQIGPKNEPN